MDREGGYTLVELMVVIALTGIIAAVVGNVMYQIVNINENGNHNLIVNNGLSTAEVWFNQDVQNANSAVGGDTLTLTIGEDTVIYALISENLQRQYNESNITLAQNISDVSFGVQGQLVTIDITADIDGRNGVNEQREYTAAMRVVSP